MDDNENISIGVTTTGTETSKTVIVETEVFCTLQIEGIHNWPACPFDEVAYLRDLHRHVFHIKAHKIVDHTDRDVEFIMLKHKIEKYLKGKYVLSVAAGIVGFEVLHGGACMFGAMSCEMIASELCSEFDLRECEVSEDGENGSIVRVTEFK